MFVSSTKKGSTRRRDNSRGFTLVELMVSLSIFSIVMVISVGTLLILIDINAKAQALYSSTTNLSFALDSMTREIRTGYHYHCYGTVNGLPGDALPAVGSTADCPTGGNSVAFIREKNGWQVGYRLNAGKIEQKVNNPNGSTGDTNWTPITSRDVIVETFEVVVENSTPYYPSESNQDQPTISVIMRGSVNNGLDTDTEFNIQTHIVERRLDII